MSDRKTVAPPRGARDAMEDLVRKMYISNVSKRLRELNQPTEIDKKRWIWELIQNAKDTIANDDFRDVINVKIKIDGDTVIFTHDGNPFTLGARFGLLWKYSEDKENQESTGRFGTGFLTTHCLSKVVSIEGDVYEANDSDKLLGFRVTMFRDGDTEAELLEGLDKMQNSEEWFEETFNHTSFTYHIKSDSGREAVKLGTSNFYDNIAQTMLFCPELGSVVMDDNGSVTKIMRGGVNDLENGIKAVSIKFTGSLNTTRTFLLIGIEKNSSELSARYKHQRRMRLQSAIEIDADNCIVDKGSSCGVYCMLPLVGIESQLDEPIYVNCPDFEPDSERQSLLLNGQDINGESGLITEVGINRMIYSNILSLYQKLLSYVVDNRSGKEYLMAKGLKSIKTHDKLDKDWYKSTVLAGYRSLLKETPICTTQSGKRIRLSESIIIKESKDSDEEKLYRLVSRIYPNVMLSANHAWASVIWKDDDICVWGIEDFCERISSTYSNWQEIPTLSEDERVEWYNDFLSLVIDYNKSLLTDYDLLPDMNGNLHKKDGSLKQNVDVSTQVFDILNKLGKDKRGELLHQKIIAVRLEGEYNSTSVAADINKCVEEICKASRWLDKLMPLMAAVPTDENHYANQPGFCTKRRDFFRISKDLYGYSYEEVEENSLIADSWRELDKHFVDAVLNEISRLGQLSALPTGLDAEWLSHTLIVLNPSIDQWKTYAVLPNQYGDFKKKEDIRIDNRIEDILKDDIFKQIGIDPQIYLLDSIIDAQNLNIEKSQDTNGVISSIRSRFESSPVYNGEYAHNYYGRWYKYPLQTLLPISQYLAGLLPKDMDSEQFELQDEFRTVVDTLSGHEVPYIGVINYSNGDFWSVPNKFVAKHIFEMLEIDKSIETTNQRLESVGTKHVLEALNVFHDVLNKMRISYDDYSIIPNQYGFYCKLSSLYDETTSIDEELKDIAKEIPQGQDFRQILIHPEVKLKRGLGKSNEDIALFIDKIIGELFETPSNWQNEQFKNAVTKFIEVWAPMNEVLFGKCINSSSKKDAITVNVIITPEVRSRLQAMARTGTDITVIEKAEENAQRVAELEAKVAELKKLLESHAVISSEDYLNDLSDKEKRVYLEEAKKSILDDLAKEGFDISHASYNGFTCITGVKDKEGKERSIVFRSNLSHRATIISPEDWKVLTRPGAMFGIVTEHGKVGKYNLIDLLKNQEVMNIRFSSSNLDWPHHLSELTKVFHYFNGIQFDFERFIPPTLERWQSFLAPEIETGEQAGMDTSIPLPE